MASTASPPTSQPPPTAGKQKLHVPANGMMSSRSTKSSQSDASRGNASAPESTLSAKHAHDRLIFLTANFVGHIAHVTLKSGEHFSGVFAGASFDLPDQQILLKMSKRVQSPGVSGTSQANGFNSAADEYIGYGEEHLMTFDIKDITHLNVPNVATSPTQPRLANGSSFKTDVDISGNLALRERELQRWEPTEESAADLSINGGSTGNWDQFEANKRLYGVETDYDEHFYTTRIDRSHPTYKERAAAADRLARQIEGTASNNPHMAEERNLKSPSAQVDGDEDEEAKFSGVKRDFPPLAKSQPNTYTPPAKRAPTAHATVRGAPVDPAIISSQLGRPDSISKSSQPNETPATAVASAVSESLKENEGPASTKPPPATSEDESLSGDNAAPVIDNDASAALKSVSTNIDTATQDSNSQTAADATANVEHRVADAFRSFAAIEKQNYRDKQKAKLRSEREYRLNDLKKFSANFKLHTAVPEDILGILAREKPKQVEIVAKAQQEVEDHKAALADKAHKSSMSADSPDLAHATPETQPEPSAMSTNVTAVDRTGSKGARPTQPAQSGRKPDRNQHQGTHPHTTPRAPGYLGQRLMQQQQYQNRPDPRFPQMPLYAESRMQQQQQQQQPPPPPPQGVRPTDLNTDVAVPRQSATVTPTSSSARFNAQAHEFKPNPTASTFQPTREESSAAASQQSREGSVPPKRPVNRVSFFADKKPQATSEKKSIVDHFNPIARMKREAVEANKGKDYAANGGIPQAYRTPPVWDAGKGNEEKSYQDMFEQGPPSAPSVSPGSYAMAHQHQLPPHLQQGSHTSPPAHTPQQGFRMQPPAHPREAYFDDHRMHHSPSQQSSVQPSPSMRQPILAYPPAQQIGTHMQPHFIQNVGQFPVGMNGNPMTPMRQVSAGPYMNPPSHMATPMMPSHSSNGQYLGFPVQGQMPMFSPPGQQVFPTGMVAPHTPTPGGGFPSPRPGPQMMVPQGSQQGPGGSPFMTQGPGQQPGPGFYGKQHHPNQISMRGGVPMMQQNSYGAHMPPQFPAQHRGSMPQMGGVGYVYQQMHPNQMMQMPFNQPLPPGPMRHPSETPDAK